jgi:hypothetical protein
MQLMGLAPLSPAAGLRAGRQRAGQRAIPTSVLDVTAGAARNDFAAVGFHGDDLTLVPLVGWVSKVIIRY